MLLNGDDSSYYFIFETALGNTITLRSDPAKLKAL